MDVSFIGFFIVTGNNSIFGDYELEPKIIGTLLMIFHSI